MKNKMPKKGERKSKKSRNPVTERVHLSEVARVNSVFAQNAKGWKESRNSLPVTERVHLAELRVKSGTDDAIDRELVSLSERAEHRQSERTYKEIQEKMKNLAKVGYPYPEK